MARRFTALLVVLVAVWPVCGQAVFTRSGAIHQRFRWFLDAAIQEPG